MYGDEGKPNNDNLLEHMEIQSHVSDEEGLDEVSAGVNIRFTNEQHLSVPGKVKILHCRQTIANMGGINIDD